MIGRWNEVPGVFRYSISEEVEKDLARIEELRVALDARGALPRRWYGRLRRELEAESAAATTSMEGVPVTEEVRRLYAGDVPSSLEPGDVALVEGYRHAMRLVLRRVDDPGFSWEKELILAIHDKVLGESHVLRAGRFRTIAVWISDGRSDEPRYTAPAPGDVPRLVGALAEYLQSEPDLPAPVLSALAHVRLAAIHPFNDGNGRTSRIVASLVLYRAGYRAPEFTSLEEWWGRHRADYYAAFECLGSAWREDADVSPFVAAHVRAQRLQADTLSLRQATERELWDALESVAVDSSSDARTANALWDGFFARPVTNRYYRGIADISAPTAAIDLSRLAAARLMAPEGAGPSVHYVPTSNLLCEVARVLGFDDLAGSGAPDDMVRDLIIGKLATRIRLSGPAYTAGLEAE
jgi:Fic family protein